MKDVGTKAAHEQPGLSKEPVLPTRPDIQSANSGDVEVAYTGKITLGRSIPRDGPEEPRMRMLIAYVVLFVWALWVIFGLVRLSLTGDSTMLLAAPALLLVPLIIVLKYYFSVKRRRRSR
jgi:hypothetical protein